MKSEVKNMAGSLDIYPFHDTEGAIRFGIQVGIFLIGVVVAQKFIIAPALSLHNERKNRTQGSNETAKIIAKKSQLLEQEYQDKLKKATDEAKIFKSHQIQSAQITAHHMISESQKKAATHLHDIQESLSEEKKLIRNTLSKQVDELVTEIYKKIGLTVLLLGILVFSLHTSPAEAFTDLNSPHLYNIFWPYFQFLCFMTALIFFAKKPLTAMLEKRREDFKTKLSEAKQALLLAERAIKVQQEKINQLELTLQELQKHNNLSIKIETEKIMTDATQTCEAILKDVERTAKELILRNTEEIKKELFQLALEKVHANLRSDDLRKLETQFKHDTINSIKMLKP
jgi:F0F1-type ATP synthase membrane subunit b/b'